MHENNEDLLGHDPADLVRAIASRRDPAAFAALFDLYGGRLKGWLMRSGSSAEAAEDLVQETLLTLWRKAELYDPGRASVSAWVFTIARNARIDRLRQDNRSKQYLHYELVEPEQPERPDVLLDSVEREERVRAALGRLSDEQVRVVRLSFFEGRAHGDIAASLGIPLGTVKSRLRLAMARLRDLLGDLT
jgi:RNA polymerase sigma-70 factor (ECF subfamily)